MMSLSGLSLRILRVIGHSIYRCDSLSFACRQRRQAVVGSIT
jgi:hypothetical protein